MDLSLLHIGVILICIIDSVDPNQMLESKCSNIDEIDAMASSIRAKYQQLKMMKARDYKSSSFKKSSGLFETAQELKIEQEIFELGKVLKRKLKSILSEDQMKYLKYKLLFLK